MPKLFITAAAILCPAVVLAGGNEASTAHLAELRADVVSRLTQAVTAIQAQMPTNPGELEAVFRTQNCFYPYRHVNSSLTHVPLRGDAVRGDAGVRARRRRRADRRPPPHRWVRQRPGDAL